MSEAVALAAVPNDKRPQVEALLADVFALMDYPAKLDFKDMPDGSLGVAVHFEKELPGISPGKQRSYLIDCVQFWLNKVVNRPNLPRRWVNLGINAFPEPRQANAPAAREAIPVPAPSAKRAEAPKKMPEPPQKLGETGPVFAHVKRTREIDEHTLTPAADPAMSALGKLMAEKASASGRLYGVMLLTAEARALMLKATEKVKGVTAKAEGEGHWRRLVLVPEKLNPILKKQVMPDYDDEEEDE